MRYTVTILLLLISTVVFAQKADTISLKKAVTSFNDALVKRDTVQLKTLLDDKLNYGHSNAWIQTKKDIIADLYNGTLTYTSINQEQAQIIQDGNTALVRAVATLDVVMKGKAMQFKLNVMQVWIYKKGWRLIGRQSVKI
ncbi:MAG: nuclear transport factor 2 family protein [Bacteroidetes bacterium]|nr:nuclear transport factor 2 family protein [Bacteroidota bacterium]